MTESVAPTADLSDRPRSSMIEPLVRGKKAVRWKPKLSKSDQKTKAGRKVGRKRSGADEERSRSGSAENRNGVQITRQFNAFQLACQGFPTHQIAEALHCSIATIQRDVRLEGERRSAEISKDRDQEVARVLGTVDQVTRHMMKLAPQDAKAASVIVKGAELRARILGLEAPKKIAVAAFKAQDMVLLDLPADERRQLMQLAIARDQSEKEAETVRIAAAQTLDGVTLKPLPE